MPAFPRWNTTHDDYPITPAIVPNRQPPRLTPRPTTTATASPSTSHTTPNPASSSEPPSDATTSAYFDHSSAKRVATDLIVTKALKAQYPNLQLVVVPEQLGYGAATCDLLSYAAAGFASYEPLSDDGGNGTDSLEWTYLYKWQGHEFIVYLVDGRDGTTGYVTTKNYYVLAPETYHVDRLVLAAGSWSEDLHDEVWVYDQGSWQKSRDLFESTRNASWENVILDADMKKALIDDHLSFRNGKTISIKATMRMLYEKKIPTLYVRTLTSYAGPEYSLGQIFGKARQFAPCYLVFEDLDTIVSDDVRSYFLNEMDGLKANDGILVIGSTNHLDRLDPGISKRPSRFDRKYYFPDPDLEQRAAYCKFWQKKLKSNKEIEFPDKLCTAIAKITGKFSFAYIQEAFVAALLAIAQKEDDRKIDDIKALTEQLEDDWLGVVDAAADDEGLDKLILWVEIKRQIEILREGMEDKK
uniref:ATP-dependent zn protease n=1 Tax=Colletotrichum fructicola (strain Nara gc5) TaxID=1213859 RepID=L2G0W1_COLFN